jgi:arylsulfatase A-like enzyme
MATISAITGSARRTCSTTVGEDPADHLRSAPEADATRGTTCDALVESIDLAATFVEAAGGKVPDHIIEGRSLMPWLRGETPENWRDFAISEYDYSVTPQCVAARRWVSAAMRGSSWSMTGATS